MVTIICMKDLLINKLEIQESEIPADLNPENPQTSRIAKRPN